MLKDCPSPLLKKIYITAIIGFGSIILGVSYHLIYPDKVFLFMSLFIFIASMVKSVEYYFIYKNKKYELIEGVCTEIGATLFGKFLKVKITDDENVETTIKINKDNSLKIGEKYKFYFKTGGIKTSELNYANTLLATDNFLGYEIVFKET